ncbi:unnamed protein product, partial [Prorocentrum cordatum]
MVAELATASSRWAPPPWRGALAIAFAAAAAGRALIHGDQLTQQQAKVYVYGTKQLDKVFVTTGVQDEVYVTTEHKDEVYVTTELKYEVYLTTEQKDEVYVTTELKDEVYVTTELKDEVYMTTNEQNEVYVTTDEQDEVYVTTDKETEVYLTTDEEYEVYVTTDKQDEVYVTMTEPGAERQGFGLKPPTFDGNEETWTEWSFVMRAYLGGQTTQTLKLLEAVEQRADPDISMAETLHRLGAEGVTATKKMFFALVMTVKGSAQMLLTRSVEDQNGALARRALIKRCEPATAMSAQNIMTAVLNVKNFPSDQAGSEQYHSDWGRDTRRCETASGEVFNAGVKRSIYLQKAPKNIITVRQMQSERSYDELVATTIQMLYLQAAT